MPQSNFSLKKFFFPTFLFCCLLLPATPSARADGSLHNGIDRLISNGGYILSKNNQIIGEKNSHGLFIPASIWKIATAASALDLLGANYRFQTKIFVNSRNDLYIQGFGDPLLTSEAIQDITVQLKKKGLTSVHSIFLDDSAFNLQSAASGAGNSLNPYDAANSALAANFNTINLVKAKDGSIGSAEPQTPTLPLMIRHGKNLPAGEHRINLSRNHENILLHVGELFRAILNREGIKVQGSIKKEPVPQALMPIYVHHSPRLDTIINKMLHYSNNFIANQLLLICGAKQQNFPATWAKGRFALNHFLLTTIRLKESEFKAEEGSGLSRKNRITPAGMLRILKHFKNHHDLLTKQEGVWIKSGTLNQVFSYVGYIPNKNQLDFFVIILNQTENNRDRILGLLKKQHGVSAAQP
jgi:D-alanyl-D-alanine carboxypeptidase/D-alanyl-D-alanine-endopeptidase (penicillin-binding protein 4)